MSCGLVFPEVPTEIKPLDLFSCMESMLILIVIQNIDGKSLVRRKNAIDFHCAIAMSVSCSMGTITITI